MCRRWLSGSVAAVTWLQFSALQSAALVNCRPICRDRFVADDLVRAGLPVPWRRWCTGPRGPIENFVATGPYFYVRNPMLIGVILFQGAEAAFLQSRAGLG